MNWKICLKLIAVCGLCLLLRVNLTAQQNKQTDEMTTKTTVQARPLGQATVTSGPTACNGGEICYDLKVACSELPEPISLSLRVRNPASQVSPRGTIIFMSGGGGTRAWDENAEPRRVAGELRAAGFRTVILQWATGWLISPTGWHVGHGKLACRPATAARWIYDNLHAQSSTTAFCATGNSGGSAQVAYMIAQYGLADIFSAVVPSAGPPTSRIDLGCLKHDTAKQSAWYDDGGNAGTVDMGFGYAADLGPCTSGNFGFRKRFQEASVAFGDWQYNYPRTMVWLLLGAQDHTAAVGQSVLFQQRLLDAGSPFVRFNIVPNTPHEVHGTPEGANMIRDIMLNECRLR